MQIDMTRPNTARVLDYWMGGTHHFEIDRQFADQVAQAVPLIVDVQRRARQTLERVVRYLVNEQGLDTIVDFGAGLPTCNNTHLVARAVNGSVRVLYNDIDPLTVYFAQQILQATPGVLYVQGDAQDPARILEAADSRAFLNGARQRRVGILYMALAHLMTDAQVTRAAQALYAWSAPGSCWFFTHATPDWETDPALAAANEFYSKARIQSYLRSPEELLALLHPWRVAEGGATFNHQWGMPAANPDPPRPIFSFEVLVTR